MKKDRLKMAIEEYGDAIITYRSSNSNKLKYNVCTLDFDNDFIQSKNNRAEETEDTLLMFCWDTESYRLMKPAQVTSVVPLSSILKNERD
jgi:hypothetical protein